VNGQSYRASTVIAAPAAFQAAPRATGIHERDSFLLDLRRTLYRRQRATLAVIGSDNAAGQHALSLSRIAESVVLICRSRRLKMDAAHQKLIAAQPNVDVMIAVTSSDSKAWIWWKRSMSDLRR